MNPLQLSSEPNTRARPKLLKEAMNKPIKKSTKQCIHNDHDTNLKNINIIYIKDRNMEI